MAVHELRPKPRKSGQVVKPLEVEVDGEKWALFTAEFREPCDGYANGKPYRFEFYARNPEHADRLIAALKSSAVLQGELFGAY